MTANLAWRPFFLPKLPLDLSQIANTRRMKHPDLLKIDTNKNQIGEAAKC